MRGLMHDSRRVPRSKKFHRLQVARSWVNRCCETMLVRTPASSPRAVTTGCCCYSSTTVCQMFKTDVSDLSIVLSTSGTLQPDHEQADWSTVRLTDSHGPPLPKASASPA